MDAEKSDNQMSELGQYNDTIRYFVQTQLTDAEGNLLRPKMSTIRIVSVYVLWLVPTIVTCVLLHYFSLSFLLSLMIVLFVIVLSTCLFAKRIVFSSVLLWQKYGPETMRRSCVFQPSCSNYMILAVEKYGVIRGVKKGVQRIKRCVYPNHGIDYP